MSRPRFSTRIQCWVPDSIADAFEALANDGLLKPSDHIRLALSNHLRSLGISVAPRPAAPNGQHHQQQEQSRGVQT